MADSPDVKDLLLRVDATTELLRRNLDKAQAELGKFQEGAQRTLDATDKGFAQLGRGLDSVVPAVARTNAQLGTIGATTKRIQLQVEASSSVMASALERVGGALAGAFAIDKVREFADGYTRFTNSLRVAGVEGSKLVDTQQALFETAQRYGVNVEAIGDLYSRAAQASHGIGASQGDVLKFSQAVAAAVKIQGGSAESAKDTIIQLGQALDSGVVHAQEYNSVTMGLYPLLQAVAKTSDKFAGSVSNIRKEMLAGKLTSADFFTEIVKAQSVLEDRAGSAHLTIGASIQVLNNALGKYIGEADAGLSATDRFGQGVQLLARNLDTVLPALTSLAIAYGAVKVGGRVLGGIDSSLGAVEGTTAAILRGNAAYVDRVSLAARVAIAAQEEAHAEVAALEETLAARRADQEGIAQTIALIEQQQAASAEAAQQQRFNSQLNFGLGRAVTSPDADRAGQDARALINVRQAQKTVDAEVAVVEGELAAAQARAAVATEGATVATTAATLSARAAATATAVFAGALDLVVSALPLLAIAGLVAAIIHVREVSAETTKSLQAFDEHGRQLAVHLAEAATSARGAASGIAQVGNSASASTGKMLAFAGAVGEAAQKLHDLAAARRREQVLGFAQDKVNADRDAADARTRIENRRFARNAVTGAYASADPAADARDQKIIAEATRRSAVAYASAVSASRQPLEGRLSNSEKNGGRDVPGELAQARRDLTIAQAGTDKAESNRLRAKVYELTQYQGYIKRGFSVESATSQSQADAQRLQQSGQSKLDAAAAKSAGAAGRRDAARAKADERKQAAAVRDDANDTRAYEAALRQDNDKIAAAHADLSNSAVERAQIERDRIEADRKSRNDDIAQQAKAGRFGDPKLAAERVQKLTAANDAAAKAQTDVVDLKLRREQANNEASLAEHRLQIERDGLAGLEQEATTRDQRAAIELRILGLQKEEERIRLARVLAPDSGASEGDRATAQLDSETLDARYATKGAAIALQNQGPLDQYRRQLAGDTGSMKDALQSVEVDGVKGVQDGLTGLIDGTQSAAAAFKRMATSIIADLARIAIEKGILAVIGAPLGLKTGGKIPGLATGGRIISGPGTGTSDSVLAMVDGKTPLAVSNGESVNTAKATADYWPIIDAMNRGKLKKLAAGGMVGPSAVFQPAVPDMGAIGAAQRAAMPVQLFRVITEASPYFDTRVVQVTSPMSQAAMMGGAEQARQDRADYAMSQIP